MTTISFVPNLTTLASFPHLALLARTFRTMLSINSVGGHADFIHSLKGKVFMVFG